MYITHTRDNFFLNCVNYIKYSCFNTKQEYFCIFHFESNEPGMFSSFNCVLVITEKKVSVYYSTVGILYF